MSAEKRKLRKRFPASDGVLRMMPQYTRLLANLQHVRLNMKLVSRVNLAAHQVTSVRFGVWIQEVKPNTPRVV